MISYFSIQKVSLVMKVSVKQNKISVESIEEMRIMLLSKEPISIYDSLLLDTKSALYEEKYSSAVLYTFMHLESALKNTH
jgi:hypothetical protein